MSFDYEYEGDAASFFARIQDFITDHLILCIIAAAVFVAIIVLIVVLIHMKNRHIKGVKIQINCTPNGVVLCKKCFNEYDASLMKCPFCKAKRS